MFSRFSIIRWKHLFVLVALAAAASCKLNEPEIPAVNLSITETQLNTGFEYAALFGTFTCNFTAEDLILEYSKDPSLSSATRMTAHSPKGTIYFVLNDLDIQTTYYYRYTVSNSINSVVDNQIRQFKTNDYTVPEVRTQNASSVTGTKVVLSGSVDYTCKKEILRKGFLCGKKGEEMETFPVTGEGFTLELTNLEMGTEYVFQAFAESEIGTGYGDILTFTTTIPITFSPVNVTNIKTTMARVQGEIILEDGAAILEQGIRYQETGSSTITTVPYATSARITGLSASKEYSVWYYVKTDHGDLNSTPCIFTTNSDKQGLVLEGIFSVSADKIVSFSRGIVRSDRGTKTISPYQYTMLGNQNTSDNEQMELTDMFHSFSGMLGLSGENWSVLSQEEWEYIMSYRPNAWYLYYFNIKVQGVAGAIVFPDDWDKSEAGINMQDGDSLSYQDFLHLQDLGAVFLPYSGYLVERTNKVTTHIYMDGVGKQSVLLPGILFEPQNVNFSFELSKSGEGLMENISGAVRLVKVR